MENWDVPEQLRRLLKRAGLGQREFAQAAGYRNASSVQRYLDSDEFRDQWLRRAVADKFARALVGKGDPPITREEVLAMAGIEEPGEFGLDFAGIAEAGAWRRVDMLDQTIPPPVAFERDPRYPKARQSAWLVQGDSMDEAQIPPGFYVRGIHYSDWSDVYGGELRDGLIVVVQSTRYGGSEIELTVKELRLFRDRMELWPRSSNRRHQPLTVQYSTDSTDDDSVAIIAVVTAVFFPVEVARDVRGRMSA